MGFFVTLAMVVFSFRLSLPCLPLPVMVDWGKETVIVVDKLTREKMLELKEWRR